MKDIILWIAISTSSLTWASAFGPTKVLKNIECSDLLVSLNRIRSGTRKLAGQLQLEKLGMALAHLLPGEPPNDVQTNLPALLQQVNFHSQAYDYLNTYIDYANDLLEMNPEQAKERLLVSSFFRLQATHFVANLPPTLDLPRETRHKLKIMVALFKDPQLICNFKFLSTLDFSDLRVLKGQLIHHFNGELPAQFKDDDEIDPIYL